MLYIKKISKLLLLVTPLFLGACAGLGSSSYTIRISSTPSDAVVIANGTEVGKTPLVISPDQTFPPHWQGMAYQATGTLALKKPGCKDYYKTVNDGVLSKDIHINLECSGDVTATPAAESDHTTEKATPKYEAPIPADPSHGKATTAIEQRLLELQRLYKKGLITEQEYQATKKRILNEL